MTMQKQDDQHEHTFSNYVRIRDVVQKTCQRRWTIGKSGERGSGISVLPARHDDDDDDIYNKKFIKEHSRSELVGNKLDKAVLDQGFTDYKRLTEKIILITLLVKLFLYSHMQIHAEHNDTTKTSETFFSKNIPLTLFERFACERELDTEQRLQHTDLPSPSGHSRISFSFSWTAPTEAWWPSPLGAVLATASCHQRVWSPN